MEKITLRTPYGTITGPADHAARLARTVLGMIFVYDQKWKRWENDSTVFDELNVWVPESHGAMRFVKRKTNILARKHNFEYALLRCNFDFSKAIKFAKDYLFDDDADQTPLYLHDFLAMKSEEGVGSRLAEFTYGRVLKDFDEQFRKAPKTRNSHYQIP